MTYVSTATLCKRWRYCPRAALPVGVAPAGAAALAGDSPGHGAAPYGLASGAAYARRHQPCPWAGTHAGGCPCKGLWPWPVAPLQGALAAAGCPLQPTWPWVADPAWELAVASHPSSSRPSL
ncbi:hypothetical protein BHM03_00057483 [Ensete ventricosum]|nr:hypothetical protein BHM03_00057483 [Ensete ventricosum]